MAGPSREISMSNSENSEKTFVENALDSALSMERTPEGPTGDRTESSGLDLRDAVPDHSPAVSPKRKVIRAIKIVGTLLFLGSIGACGWFYGYPFVKSYLEPKPVPPKMTLEQFRRQQAAEAAKNGGKGSSGSVSAQRPQQRQASQVQGFEKPEPRYYNSTGNLGTLSQQRGQRLLLEQSVKIAELQKRLEELKEPPEMKLAPMQPLQLPQVAPPPPAPQASPAPELPDLGVPENRPSVVSIQGSGGRLSATFRTSQGKYVTVKHGGTYNGGIVFVSKTGVQLRKDGKIQNIPFE